MFPSESSAAEAIYERSDHGQRTAIHYFGDHDPTGRDIDRQIVRGIGEVADRARRRTVQFIPGAGSGGTLSSSWINYRKWTA